MAAVKKVSARGPFLELGGGLAIDCRYVDRVELAERFADPAGLRLMVASEDTEIAIEFPGSRAEAEDVIVAIAPYTRAAPLTSEVDFQAVLAQREAISSGSYQPPAVVFVNGAPVTVADGLVSTGIIGWPLGDIEAAAKRGEPVELLDKSEAPAAVFALAIAATQPPQLASFDGRLREYLESRRSRDPS